jgi:hypothetical protein
MSILSKALAFLHGLNDSSFWTISSYGRLVGSLVYQGGEWRLSWFENADPRLKSYRGPVSEDVGELSETLSRRLGSPVSVDVVID